MSANPATAASSPAASTAPASGIASGSSDERLNRNASVEAMKLRLQPLELDDEIMALCEPAAGGIAGGSLVACAGMLAGAGHVDPAVAVLSQALTGRAAAWWACRAARLEPPGGPAPKELPALVAAEQWVREPVAANAHAAHAAAKRAGLGTPAGCAAMAAFLAGDSLAPPHLAALAPPPHAAGLAAAGAVRLAAARRPPLDEKALASLFAVGQAVAAGTDSWTAPAG